MSQNINLNNNAIVKGNSSVSVMQAVPQNTPILLIPNDVLKEIFKLLEKSDLLNCSEVCRHCYHISNEASVWRNCFTRAFPLGTIPNGVHPKTLFPGIELLHKNALNGMVSKQIILNAPDGVQFVSLMDNGTKAIGWNQSEAVIYIYDLKNSTTTVLIPEVHNQSNLTSVKQLSNSNLALIFSTENISTKTVKIIDIAKGDILHSRECHAIYFLKNGKIGTALCGKERNCLSVYDAALKTTVLQCSRQIDGVLEINEGEIIVLSNGTYPTLEIWNLKDNKCTTLPRLIDKFTDYLALEDGFVGLVDIDSRTATILNPTMFTTQLITNPEMHPSLIRQYINDNSIHSIDCSGKVVVKLRPSIEAMPAFNIHFEQNGKCSFIQFPSNRNNEDNLLDISFSSTNSLTTLGKNTIQKLIFGETHELLHAMSEEFLKTKHCHEILMQINYMLKKNENHAFTKNVDRELTILTLDPRRENNLSQIHFQYTINDNSSFLFLASPVIEIKPTSSDSLSYNGSFHYSGHPIQSSDFSDESDLEIFKKLAQELANMGSIDIGLAQRFTLLPKKVRNAIYGELETIIAPKLGYTYFPMGEHFFHGIHGKTATAEERSQAIIAYLKMQGYKAEELTFTPSEPQITLWENPPLEPSVVMQKLQNKECISAISYCGLFGIKTSKNFSEKLQIRPEVLGILGLKNSQDLEILGLDCSLLTQIASLNQQLQTLSKLKVEGTPLEVRKKQINEMFYLKDALSSLLAMTDEQFSKIVEVNNSISIEGPIDFLEWKDFIISMKDQIEQVKDLNAFVSTFTTLLSKLETMEIKRQEVTLHAYLNQWGIRNKWANLKKEQTPVLSISQLHTQGQLSLGQYFRMGE